MKAGQIKSFVCGDSCFTTRGHAGQLERVIEQSDCDRFASLACGGESTVLQIAVADDGELLVLEVLQSSGAVPGLAASIIELCQKWEADYIFSDDTIPPALASAVRTGVPVKLVKTRCHGAAEIHLAAGRIYFRKGAHFAAGLEAELVADPHGVQMRALDLAAAFAGRSASPVTVKQLHTESERWVPVC